VLAAGGSVGTAPQIHVRAALLCGAPNASTVHFSGEVVLPPGGDFFIEGLLSPAVPAACPTPALLVIFGARWLAAGIPLPEDTGTGD
jgi:hypothetical protein